MKSDLAYEKLAQGESTSPLSAHDEQRVAALRQQDQEFLKRHPVENLVLPGARSPWLPGLVSAAAVLVFAIGAGSLFVANPVIETRAKGNALSLLVYHQVGAGSELLSPKTALGANEEVQFAYYSSTKRYGAIVSVDGRGTVTVHLPLHGDQAVSLDTASPELLPYSYRLDDAPRFEALYFIASETAFAVSQLTPILKAQAGTSEPLVLPAGFVHTEFMIAKKDSTR